MPDQTNVIPVHDLDAAKKRAYAFKARAEEFRHAISMAHCYELLATSWGYKNWATVKAQLAKPSVNGAVQIGVIDEEPDAAAVRLPLSDCMSHVEIVSSADRYATQDFVMATASSLICNGNGMFLAYTGAQSECIDEVKRVARAAGREGSVRIINLNTLYRDRKGWKLDIYQMLDRQGLADLLFESMLGDFGKGDRLYAHRLRSAKFLTLALAALAELPADHRDRLTATTFRYFLNLSTLWKLARGGGLPASVMEPLVDYLRLQNVDIEKHPDVAAEDAHRFHQEALRRASVTHAEMQKDALSHNLDIGKAVQEGKIIVALLPHPDDMDTATSTMVRALMRLIGKGVSESAAPIGKPFVTIVDGADGYLRHGDSGRFLETVKAANSPAFVVSERPLALPGLRGSAAIHIRQGINRPLECVLVTDHDRTEFVFPR
ncbi:glyoxalase superfamily protein [Pararhizobium sp. BT-229]|uniref:glyoxalase superfamily protein n=1 Tax=Pararhizobium sp. BT-229 TaxID=2986923 RepID=UPI0021F72036|nr:glyoxalase superfamily protein [Pararhizobium sp. BT-229]MCV9964231.1 glyoxalase superfamily protein [Pararhizobium sp. BT-229]